MDAPLVTIRLAGIPRGKGRPKFSSFGGQPRAITPNVTRNYEASLKMAAESAMQQRAPIEGPLDVLMTAVFPIAATWTKKKKEAALAGSIRPTGKPDADNIAKMCDALNGVSWVDDSQIVDHTVRKWFGRYPCLEIQVRRAELLEVLSL